MKFAIKLICITVFLLTHTLAFAKNNTYYVTQTGSSADFSIAEFNALEGTGYAGDTFYFSGSFTTQIHVDGLSGTSEGGYVTLDGWQGGTCDPVADRGCASAAVFDVCDNNDSDCCCVYIENSDYLIVQDFEIEDSWCGILSVGKNSGSNNTHRILRRNYIHDILGNGIQHTRNAESASGTYCDWITIGGALGDGNLILETQERALTERPDSHGLGVSGADDVVVSYNEVGNSWQDLTDSCNQMAFHSGKRVLVEYNTVYNPHGQSCITFKEAGGQDKIARFNHCYGCSQQGGINTCTNQGPQDNYFFYGNYIHDSGTGIWLYRNYSNIHIWSNIFADIVAVKVGNRHELGTGNGIDVSAESGCTQGDVWIRNNTFARCDQEGWRGNKSAGLHVYGGANVDVQNNIFYYNNSDDSDRQVSQTTAGAIKTLEHNTYYSDGSIKVRYGGADRSLATLRSSYNAEDGSPAGQETNPGFVDAADDDFRLASGSPCINSGKDLSGLAGSITVQGVTYNMYWDEALDPVNTDWSTSPPTVLTVKQDHYDIWEVGAYVYRDGSGITLSPPKALRIAK